MLAPVRSSYCRATVIEPENTSTVLELYTRFLKCFVSATLVRDLGPQVVPQSASHRETWLEQWFHRIAERPRKMQDARWPFMQNARKQKST
jgi:hypothetical protein